MNNFDHVRLGNNGALIFSIENGREKTGKRAISILLSSKTGDFYGIVSSGYEGVERLKKRPQLWAGSAIITPATDSATEPVTTLDARQGGEQIGSASGQSSSLSEDKDTENVSNAQGNGEKFLKNNLRMACRQHWRRLIRKPTQNLRKRRRRREQLRRVQGLDGGGPIDPEAHPRRRDSGEAVRAVEVRR